MCSMQQHIATFAIVLGAHQLLGCDYALFPALTTNLPFRQLSSGLRKAPRQSRLVVSELPPLKHSMAQQINSKLVQT